MRRGTSYRVSVGFALGVFPFLMIPIAQRRRGRYRSVGFANFGLSKDASFTRERAIC
jgi:hypothetical protein